MLSSPGSIRPSKWLSLPRNPPTASFRDFRMGNSEVSTSMPMLSWIYCKPPVMRASFSLHSISSRERSLRSDSRSLNFFVIVGERSNNFIGKVLVENFLPENQERPQQDYIKKGDDAKSGSISAQVRREVKPDGDEKKQQEEQQQEQQQQHRCRSRGEACKLFVGVKSPYVCAQFDVI